MRVVTDRYKQERQLALKSRFDALTGALNRACLLELTANFYEQAARRKQSFAALLISVENLFVLNRTYGYDVADEMMAGLAARLRANCRERDLLARYAGNKFAVVLENCDAAEMAAAAERFVEIAAAAPFETTGGPVARCRSASAASSRRATAAPRKSCSSTPRRRWTSRASRRPRASSPMNLRSPATMRACARCKISDEIVSALNERRIMIALQPIVHAPTGEPAMFEALMRLRRADGSLAAPAAILPTAEKAGLIQLIDQRVLELALKKLQRPPRDAHRGQRVGPDPPRTRFHLAVHATLLGADEDLARRLTIEITETCVIEDVEATGRAIAAIQKLRRESRDGRFRRRPHLVQQSAPPRIRSGQDRRRLRAEPVALGRTTASSCAR